MIFPKGSDCDRKKLVQTHTHTKKVDYLILFTLVCEEMFDLLLFIVEKNWFTENESYWVKIPQLRVPENPREAGPSGF